MPIASAGVKDWLWRGLELVGGIVWVPSGERESPTPEQIGLARFFRILGVLIILFVTLAVSFATAARPLWEAAQKADRAQIAAKEATAAELASRIAAASDLAAQRADPSNLAAQKKAAASHLTAEKAAEQAKTTAAAADPAKQAPSLWALAPALLLAALYAWYAGFIVHLLLLGPPLESIRYQDAVLPGLLALAYYGFAQATIGNLPNASPEHRGWYLPIFLGVYSLWLVRDSLELHEFRRPHGYHEATKYVVRKIWVGVDVLQIGVTCLAIVEMKIACHIGPFSLKDGAVLVALLGSGLANWIMVKMRDANEPQAFTTYVAALDVDTLPAITLFPSGTSYTLVDLGCGDGRRTKEIITILVEKPTKVIGIDWSEASEAEFRKNVALDSSCVHGSRTRQGACHSGRMSRLVHLLLSHSLPGGTCHEHDARRSPAASDPSMDSVQFSRLEGLSAACVAQLRPNSDPVVLYISHYRLSTSRDRKDLRAFVEALSKKVTLCALLWRAPAPGSVRHTAAALSGGDYFAPQFSVFDAGFVSDLAVKLKLEPVGDCDPKKGKPTTAITQRLRLGNLFQATEWLACFVPPRIADRVDYWLRQQNSAGSKTMPDDDAVYAFARPTPRPTGAAAITGAP